MSEMVKKPSSTVGLRDVVWCKVETDTAPDGETPGVYETGEVLKLPGAIDVEFTNQNDDPDVQYFDDAEGDVLYPDPEIGLKLELADLPPDVVAEMVGATVDAKGVTVNRAGDKPPYIALGFKSQKSNGVDRFVWLYKGRATIPSETYHTKEGEDITRQSSKLEITFIKRNKDAAWRSYVDTDNEKFATAKATFFDAVYEPSLTA